MGSASDHTAMVSPAKGASAHDSTESACAAAAGGHQRSTATSDGRQILAEPDGGTEAKAADIVAHSFLIAADEVQQMLARHGMSEDTLLRSLIVPASKLARPYISKYFVGCEPDTPCCHLRIKWVREQACRPNNHTVAASPFSESKCQGRHEEQQSIWSVALCGRRAVGLGDSGRVYFGVNIEFPGVPLNQSVRDRWPCSPPDMHSAPSSIGNTITRHGSPCQIEGEGELLLG